MKKILKLTLKHCTLLLLPFILIGCDSPTETERKADDSLKPVADAYVKSNDADENFGALKELKVKSDSRAKVESLVKFSIPEVSGAITSVKLEMYVTDGTVDSLEVYLTGNGWTEEGVTWNNRPYPEGEKLDDPGEISKGWVTIDLTSAVDGAGEVSFILVLDSSDKCAFKSKETGKSPRLIITSDSTQIENENRSTFLVSMPLDKTESWKEMAFLATVPAATKINNGKPIPKLNAYKAEAPSTTSPV